MQKTPAMKRVHIDTVATEIDDVKLTNRDGTHWRLPPSKYPQSIYKLLFTKQKEWLWKDHKTANASGDDIPAAKGKQGQPPTKQILSLVSTVKSHCSQIDDLTAQNQWVIMALVAQE